MPRPFPPEFRRDVVAVARRGEATVAQVARDFGISESCLHHWHITHRLHGYLGYVPPTEFETTFYATHGSDQTWSQSHSPSLHQTQGDST